MNPNFEHELNGLLVRYGLKLQYHIDSCGDYDRGRDFLMLIHPEKGEFDFQDSVNHSNWLEDHYIY